MAWFQELVEQHGEAKALAIWCRANDAHYAAHPQQRLPVEELEEIERRDLGHPTFNEYMRI